MTRNQILILLGQNCNNEVVAIETVLPAAIKHLLSYRAVMVQNISPNELVHDGD